MRVQKIFCLAGIMLLATTTASAFPQFLTDWEARYGASSTSGADANCQLCHVNASGGDPWNAYGWDLVLAFDQIGCDTDASGMVSSDEAFVCTEFFNSDDDTGEHDNLAEIMQNAQPGWSLGACNAHYSTVATTPAQTAPAGIGDLDPDGTAPLTGCDTDPTDPTDPGDATIVSVQAGESIQAAIDAVAPGSTILIEPGIYHESGNSQNGLNISKGIKLIGLSDGDNGVVLENTGGQRNGVVVVPSSRTDCLSCHVTLAPPFTLSSGVATGGDTTPVIHGLEIRNLTIRGFINNGLFTERVDDFKIINVHSVDNRNYGIFPTLSSNGIIQHSSATGADDSGIWVETSTNVLVTENFVEGNVNGFEVSNSDYIRLTNNEVTNNTVGIALLVLTDLVDERPGTNKVLVQDNWIYDNNKVNSGTPGSLLSELPAGIGVLMLAVDHSIVKNNLIEDHNFFGVVIADYCLAVQGTSFDCLSNPPPATFDPVPENNKVIGNTLINNGTNPPSSPFAPFAADITLFVPGDFGNCFLDNQFTTFISIAGDRQCQTSPLLQSPSSNPARSLRDVPAPQPVFRPLR